MQSLHPHGEATLLLTAAAGHQALDKNQPLQLLLCRGPVFPSPHGRLLSGKIRAVKSSVLVPTPSLTAGFQKLVDRCAAGLG